MLKTVFTLFILVLIFTLLLWFVENDGSISINWLDYQIETSVAFALIITFLFVAVLAIFINAVSWLKNSPKKLRNKKTVAKKDKGIKAITEGFAAVTAGELDRAKKLSTKAEKNLGNIPLTRLLNTQLAEATGDSEQTKLQLTNMLDDKETEIIAIKGLLLQAKEEGDYKKAITLAKRALSKKPDSKWALSILDDIYCHNHNWDDAIEIANKSYRMNILDKPQHKRKSAMLQMAKAIDLEKQNKIPEATYLAKKSYNQLKNFTPIAIKFAQLLNLNGNVKASIKILEKAFLKDNNDKIVQAYLKFFDNESASKKIKKCEKLLKIQPENAYTNYIAAKLALDIDNIEKARKFIKESLRAKETYDNCTLMIEIEEQDDASLDVIEEFKTKALTANKEGEYICNKCNSHTSSWSVLCDNCSSFDSIFYNDNHKSYDKNSLQVLN